MKISFNYDSRDFTPWMQEKSDNLLSSLCCAMNNTPELCEDYSFLTALDEALKIFALANENLNGIHCNLISRLLTKYKKDGYDFLCDLIHNTDKGILMKKAYCCSQAENIIIMIENEDKGNRTELASVLSKIEIRNIWTEQIASDLEKVHQGECGWEWFCAKHHNDRALIKLDSDEQFIMKVYDYFQSEEYKNADKNISLCE